MAGLAAFLGLGGYWLGVGSSGAGGAVLAQSLRADAVGSEERSDLPKPGSLAGMPPTLAGPARVRRAAETPVASGIVPPDLQFGAEVQIRSRPAPGKSGDTPVIIAAAGGAHATRKSPPILPDASQEQIAAMATSEGVRTKSAPAPRPGSEDPSPAPDPTIDVAAALQAGVESTMGQEVTHEVILLAQTLSRSSSQPSSAPANADDADRS
jgi:hypothetical protein